MDPFGIAAFEDTSESTDTSQKADNLFQTNGDDFDDIFGTGFGSGADKPAKMAEKGDKLFSFDDADEDSATSAVVFGEDEVSDTLFKLTDVRGGTVASAAATSSLFDDLLDFSDATESSATLASEFLVPQTLGCGAGKPENAQPAPKPVSDVDLLFGLDDDFASPSPSQQEVKGVNPDILDFVDSTLPVLPEASDMEVSSSMTSDPSKVPAATSDGPPDNTSKEDKSPSVLVVAPSIDLLDEADAKMDSKETEEEEKDGKKEEEKDGNENTFNDGDATDKTSHYRDSSSNQGLDFSLLETSHMSHLNCELSKHKRTLSKKGSIARRKRPTRAAILSGSDQDDAMFQDSTEPKSPKPPSSEEEDEVISPGLGKGDCAQAEEVPAKKFAGGVKIPGLLEGLSQSKQFNKSEKKSSSESGAKELTSTATSLPVKSSIQPKPLVLPRVLPKPAQKVLKDTQNQDTADKDTKTTPLVSNEKKVSPFAKDSPRVPPINTASQDVPPKSDSQKSSAGQVPPEPDVKVPPSVPSKPSLLSKLKRVSSERVPDKTPMQIGRSPEKAPLVAALTKKDTEPKESGSKKIEAAAAKTNGEEAPSNKSTPISRVSVKKAESVGAADSLRLKSQSVKSSPQDSSKSVGKTSHDKSTGDVVDSKDATDAGKTVVAGSVATSSPSEPSEPAKVPEEPPKMRKTSFSGITPVKSPVSADKVPSSATARKGSITSTAYNPIGFRAPLASTDGESRSRENSVSSSDDNVVSTSTAPVPADTKLRSDSGTSSDGQWLRGGSVTVSAPGQSKSATDSPANVSKEKPSQKPAWLLEMKNNLNKTSKGGEERRKDVVEETNRIIKEQSSPARESGSTSKNGESPEAAPGEKKTSPWGVKLKKVEKKDTSPGPSTTTNNENSSPAVNWRQQMSQKRKNSLTPIEPEKPKQQDSTPEWARASVQRRQRLLDAGIIKAEAK